MSTRQTAIVFVAVNLLLLFGLIYKKSRAIGLQYKQQQLQLQLNVLEQEQQSLQYRFDRLTSNKIIENRAIQELQLQPIQLQQIQKIS